MKYILETSRLALRTFQPKDANSMYQLNANPEVLRYTGDMPFESVASASQFIANYDAYEKMGFGRWAVILKSDGRFIGWCGLKRNEEHLVDIGFRFFQTDWGKGYATESAKAVIHYGFEQLGLTEIIGRAATANKASIRVLEKLNMQFWKYDTCEGIENSAYYRIVKSS